MKGRYIKLSFYSHNVRIRLEGFRVGRLLDKAVKNGVVFKDVEYISSVEIKCSVCYEDYLWLKKEEKALYRINIISERGLLHRISTFFKRPVKVIGSALMIMIILGQSMFIKEISVQGYKAVPEEELRNCLAENGVCEGALKFNINWEKAENAIYETFPQVVWASLGYKGRLAVLSVSETGSELYLREEEVETLCANMVAAESGYVETINVWRGLATVERGDFVEKGQVLISGYVPIEPSTFDEADDDYYLVNAEGEVWARIPYRLEFNQERFTWDGREKTEQEIEARVNQQIRSWTEENLDEKTEIVNKSLNFSVNNNIIIVGVTLEVRKEIGIIQEDLIGKDYSDTGRD